MNVSDRSNWLLSGLVGVLLVANGFGWSYTMSDTILGLIVGGALAVGGGAAVVNAVKALRDPDAVDQEWTDRKTATNVVAVVLLTGGLAAALLT